MYGDGGGLMYLDGDGQVVPHEGLVRPGLLHLRLQLLSLQAGLLLDLVQLRQELRSHRPQLLLVLLLQLPVGTEHIQSIRDHAQGGTRCILIGLLTLSLVFFCVTTTTKIQAHYPNARPESLRWCEVAVVLPEVEVV